MSSNNPCAVYNFYNCCDGNGPGSSGSALFIWQSGSVLDPQANPTTATLEPLRPIFGLGNMPDGALKAYLGLLPLHRKAQLQEISLLRFTEMTSGAAYTASVGFDLVVMDYAGAVKRTISTAPLNYRNVPLTTWTPITLSTTPGDLDIIPGELVAGQLTFGAAIPSTSSFVALYQLSGTGLL